MKILSISFTNAHMSKIIWMNSRPALKDEEIILEDILKLDLPVNEFSTAILFIESTVLVREIITSMRDHVMWAQTSRVQDVLKFEYPDSFDKNVMEEFRSDMQKDADSGIRQDEYRSHLPIAALTRYSIAISARNLIRLSNFFKHIAKLNTDFSQEFLKADLKLSYCADIMGFPYRIHQNYKMIEPLFIGDISERIKPIRIGKIITGSFRITVGLRAQLVRHRGLLVEDNLFERIELLGQFVGMDTILIANITANVKEWENVIRKRSCWIANYGVWKDIIEQVYPLIGKDLPLPCDGGVCPFNADAIARFEGKDPNPPCPINVKLNNLISTDDQIDKMRNLVECDNRSPLFWIPKIEELL